MGLNQWVATLPRNKKLNSEEFYSILRNYLIKDLKIYDYVDEDQLLDLLHSLFIFHVINFEKSRKNSHKHKYHISIGLQQSIKDFIKKYLVKLYKLNKIQ
jgi:hypothetical protein